MMLSGSAEVLIVVFSTMAIISTIAIGLRVYVQIWLLKCRRGKLEDWTAVVGWFLFITFGAILCATIYYGSGHSVDQIPFTKVPVIMKVIRARFWILRE